MADATAPVHPDATNDRRWVQFNGPGVDCSCGEHHVGLFSLQMIKPVGWPGPDEPEPDEALRIDGNFLSKSYCVRDSKYFAIRMSLPLAIQGIPPPSMLLSVWASVDKSEFRCLCCGRSQQHAQRQGAYAGATCEPHRRFSGHVRTYGRRNTATERTAASACTHRRRRTTERQSDHSRRTERHHARSTVRHLRRERPRHAFQFHLTGQQHDRPYQPDTFRRCRRPEGEAILFEGDHAGVPDGDRDSRTRTSTPMWW